MGYCNTQVPDSSLLAPRAKLDEIDPAEAALSGTVATENSVAFVTGIAGGSPHATRAASGGVWGSS